MQMTKQFTQYYKNHYFHTKVSLFCNMLKLSSYVILLYFLTMIIGAASTPIHNISKKSDKISPKESSFTTVFRTLKPFRFNAFANRKMKERLAQNFDAVNIMKRKPNILLNVETTTVGVKLNRKSRHKIQSSGKSFKKFTGIYIPIPATKKLFDSLLLITSPKPETIKDSFMEFYYWGDFGKNKVREFKKVKNRKAPPDNFDKENEHNDIGRKTTSFTIWEKQNQNNNNPSVLPPYYGFRLGFTKPTPSKFVTKVKLPPATYFVNFNSTLLPDFTFSIDGSTINDKIKFFETYDNVDRDDYVVENVSRQSESIVVKEFTTSTPIDLIPLSIKYLNDTATFSNKTLDFDIDISVYEDENKTRFAVKDLTSIDTAKDNSSKEFEVTELLTFYPRNLTSASVRTYQNNNEKKIFKNRTAHFSNDESNYSKQVSCTKFPFVAAYVYEPLQVFCDAASVSRYWLLTSASCLLRKNKGLMKSPQWTQERSAFVSYCSDKWWDPQSITYVKDIKIHPQFDLQDRSSHYLYNIGLILVVNAMSSSCIFWSPVSMLSRRLITKPNGHEGYAVGWGLDRYDTKSSADVPKHQLAIYKGTVFSSTCPGNVGYSKIKGVLEAEVFENIYCLSLPPYFGEELDPLHGSLLLERGQLIGLYLEEERRSFGPQTAQYTAVWKHVSWIIENTKDPEDNNFQIDIM